MKKSHKIGPNRHQEAEWESENPIYPEEIVPREVMTEKYVNCTNLIRINIGQPTFRESDHKPWWEPRADIYQSSTKWIQ